MILECRRREATPIISIFRDFFFNLFLRLRIINSPSISIHTALRYLRRSRFNSQIHKFVRLPLFVNDVKVE